MKQSDISSLSKEQVILEIGRLMSDAKAADAADLFLSPHINPELLQLATSEQGPAMWIVNRSDVFTETLQLFTGHNDPGIALRAQDKIRARKNPSPLLPDPEPYESLGSVQTPDFEVEEILGHPRVALNAVVHFSYALKDEHRASAALSAFRRVVEYPPTWSQEKIGQDRITQRLAEMLLGDPSALVRSYASRFPLLDASIISQAITTEKNPTVKGRLLQHPHTARGSVIQAAQKTLSEEEDPFVETVLSLDSRVPKDLRVELLKRNGGGDLPFLAELFHLYQT
jgi:hypothetical protein